MTQARALVDMVRYRVYHIPGAGTGSSSGSIILRGVPDQLRSGPDLPHHPGASVISTSEGKVHLTAAQVTALQTGYNNIVKGSAWNARL
jgi:hypothetical protein